MPDLPAGPDLDAQVALALGFRPVDAPAGGFSCWEKPNGDIVFPEYFRPSTDLRQAMECLEQLPIPGDGWRWCYTLMRRLKVCTAGIFCCNREFGIWDNFEADGDTLPLAISRAIVRAGKEGKE